MCKGAPIIITHDIREDYEKYLLGELKQVDIARNRGIKTSRATKMFSMLFEEKMNDLRDVKVSKQLNPELQNFEQWLAQNAKKIPL